MGRLFGTDGVRGIANTELTPELAFDLGRAGGYVLARDHEKPLVLIGKDTRVSGDMLEAALVAGLCSLGAEVYLLGAIPTPAVAYLTRCYGAAAGAVISASHNPMEYNGIKFFSGDGFKLPDETEDEIERLLKNLDELPRPEGAAVGRVNVAHRAGSDYLDYLVGCYQAEKDCRGLTIVVDCANGASSCLAPVLWERLGAKVIAINDKPDGTNINAACGSTHPEGLRQAVLKAGADLGIAHDGDADRVIMVDEKGQVLDGDHIMAICALHLKGEGSLNPPRVVATVMSNIGLDMALRPAGIEIDSCQVGDRYVLETMLKTGARLGGEQSGHIIFLDYATTGDGLLSALKTVEVMVETGCPLSELASVVRKQPQILVNIETRDRSVLEDERVKEAIKEARLRLGEWGKVVVRPSGTEPKLRIMAQGPDEEKVRAAVDIIAAAVNRATH